MSVFQLPLLPEPAASAVDFSHDRRWRPARMEKRLVL